MGVQFQEQNYRHLSAQALYRTDLFVRPAKEVSVFVGIYFFEEVYMVIAIISLPMVVNNLTKYITDHHHLSTAISNNSFAPGAVDRFLWLSVAREANKLRVSIGHRQRHAGAIIIVIIVVVLFLPSIVFFRS